MSDAIDHRATTRPVAPRPGPPAAEGDAVTDAPPRQMPAARGGATRARGAARGHGAPVRRRGRHPVVVLLTLGGALVAACLLASAMGAFAVPPGEVLASILRKAGLAVGPAPSATAEALLWEVRFPRVALAVLVGASLGCAGAITQGTFSNPLADPGIIGVSSGAAVGAVISIVVGLNVLGPSSLPFAAFAGGLLTVFVVYQASRSNGRTEIITLVLTGIAVNAFTGALIGLLSFFSSDAALRSIVFWTLGSLAQATWAKVLIVLPFAIAGMALSLVFAGRLDLLALGDRPARHLGVDVERLRIMTLAVVAVLTAAAVAVSGEILFVGLVIPHLVRMVVGPGHRLLLPASALAGATILVVADLIARTVAAPAELPLGVLTALIGSPFFFWQLRRTRRTQGGWA